MRASLGFRAGPLYIGTGNLLKTKPRGKQQRSSGEIIVLLIVVPFIVLYFAAVILWWLLAAAWTGTIRLATRGRAPAPTDAAPATGEPADDPCWTPTRRS